MIRNQLQPTCKIEVFTNLADLNSTSRCCACDPRHYETSFPAKAGYAANDQFSDTLLQQILLDRGMLLAPSDRRREILSQTALAKPL